MLKPKGLSQDALVRLSCGGALEHFQLRRPAFPFHVHSQETCPQHVPFLKQDMASKAVIESRVAPPCQAVLPGILQSLPPRGLPELLALPKSG